MLRKAQVRPDASLVLIALTTLAAACGSCGDERDDARRGVSNDPSWTPIPDSGLTATPTPTYDPDAGMEVINEAWSCSNLPALINTRITQGGSANVTLRGTVLVEGEVLLNGAGETLRIEPGTTVLMAPRALLRVDHGARIEADGTKERPIRFCAANGISGSWRGVAIEEYAASAGYLKHVLVSGGGGSGLAVGVAAPIEIEDLRVVDSGSDGIRLAGARSVRGLAVERSKGKAVGVTNPGVLKALSSVTLQANGTDAVELQFDQINDGYKNAEHVIPRIGAPYLVSAPIDVLEKLTIEAGTDIRFARGAGLRGGDPHEVELQVLGTAEAPVLLRGMTEEPDAWAGVFLGRATHVQSKLAHVEIRHAAQALGVEAAVTLDHVTATQGKHGLRIGYAGLSQQSSSLSATKNAGSPIAAHANALVSLPAGLVVQGNARDWIDVTHESAVERAGRVESTGIVRNYGVPYHVLGLISLQAQASLTIEPGTEFVMAASSVIDLGYEWEQESPRWVAIGSAEKPIRFRGETPTPGYWRGFLIGDVHPETKFAHVHVSDAGKASYGVVHVANRDVSITHSTFSNYLGVPVTPPPNSSVDYRASNTF